MLRQKVAEFKKCIGKEPDGDKLRDILFTCMDVNSKLLASQSKLDVQQEGVDMYQALCEDIDRRYKIEFGTLEIKGRQRDDPMGLHNIDDGQDKEFEEVKEVAAQNDIDAVQKGKGKGKGKNDGRCNICMGEGHFARDFPSVEPTAPTAVECHGCHGRWHYKSVCPTANPQLKGAGKGGWQTKGAGGKGGWQTNGGGGDKGKGKGKGYSGGGWKGKGKGKGGKGGGIYEIGLMGAWGGDWNWDDESWGDDTWGGNYLRSFSIVMPARRPIAISDRYEAIAEDDESESSRRVPIEDLIVKDTGKHRLRKRKG